MDQVQGILNSSSSSHNNNNAEYALDPKAVGICIVLTFLAAAIWFCLPPLSAWDVSDDDSHGLWFFDDYKVQQEECKDSLRKSHLTFRVRKQDFIHENNNNNNNNNDDDDDDDLSQISEDNLVEIASIPNSTTTAFVDLEACPVEESSTSQDTCCSSSSSSNSSSITAASDTSEIPILRVPLRIKHHHSKPLTVPSFCAICLEKFQVDDELAVSSNVLCNHVFHIDCISECIDKKKGAKKPCPCCRECFFDAIVLLDKVKDDDDDDGADDTSATDDFSI